MFFEPFFRVRDTLFDYAFGNAKLVIFVRYVDAAPGRLTATDFFVVLGAKLLALSMIHEHFFLLVWQLIIFLFGFL